MIDILFIVAPHSLLLDLAGPAEAFRLANTHLQKRDEAARFKLRFAAASPQAVSSVGLSLAGLEALPKGLPKPTWVVLLGQPSATLAAQPSNDAKAITHKLCAQVGALVGAHAATTSRAKRRSPFGHRLLRQFGCCTRRFDRHSPLHHPP